VMVRQPEATTKLLNMVASRSAYEDWHARYEMEGGANTPWHKMVIKHLQPSRDLIGKRVLEIGCGLGGFACWLATQAERTHAAHAARGLRRDVGRALRLAARNPRVLFIDAMSDYQLAPELGGNKERALVKLRQAVAAFELERAGTEQLPGWGAAEAYELLARDLLDQGETLGARDALEHALLLAPEFSQARRLMAQIISG